MLVKVDVAPLYKGLLPWQMETGTTVLIKSYAHSALFHVTLDVQGTALPLLQHSLHNSKLLPQLEIFLTVSHLALALSSSNLANSLRSWMVIKSFQMSRPMRPNSRMAPATAKRTTKMLGPSGHSERPDKQAESECGSAY